MFELKVLDVFNFDTCSVIMGSATDPLYEGKVKSGSLSYDIQAAWDNGYQSPDKLSFLVKNEKVPKSLIGETLKSVA